MSRVHIDSADLLEESEYCSGDRATSTSKEVLEWSNGETRRITDHLIEEAAVALVYNGISHAVMMVTPSALEAFALGFSLSEGIIERPDQLYDLHIDQHKQGTTISMQISPECFARLKNKRRNMTGRTGCGLCGSESLEQAERQPIPHLADSIYSHHAIENAIRQFESSQPLRQLTGAAHGAALCDENGVIKILCEDIGRHNALDKLYGESCNYAGLNSTKKRANCFILISSRASYELVLKASAVGVGMLVAVSAPTGLAVQLAEQANMILAGFARDGRHIIYTYPDRALN